MRIGGIPLAGMKPGEPFMSWIDKNAFRIWQTDEYSQYTQLPFRYEIDTSRAGLIIEYLLKHLPIFEWLELWYIWIGHDPGDRVLRY